MRFLVDECTGPAVAARLREDGHEVFSVYDEDRGADDVSILNRAVAEDRILVTIDKDFGDLIFRQRRPHRGVVLLRLADERAVSKIAVLLQLIADHGPRLSDNFVVATEFTVRFSRP